MQTIPRKRDAGPCLGSLLKFPFLYKNTNISFRLSLSTEQYFSTERDFGKFEKVLILLNFKGTFFYVIHKLYG